MGFRPSAKTGNHQFGLLFFLAPILFIVFIIDLATTTGSLTELYADDAFLRGTLPKQTAGAPPTALANPQVAITNASSWAQSWHDTFIPIKRLSYRLALLGLGPVV